MKRVMNSIAFGQNNGILRYTALLLITISILLGGCAEESPAVAEEVQAESINVVPPLKNTGISSLLNNPGEENEVTYNAERLEVHYIDVGEGDSALITCGDDAMLIDAGDPTMGTTVRLYLKNHGITHLKYLLLTHSDKDHIGGAASVISNFDIDEIFMCRYEKDNDVYLNLLNEIDYKSMTWRTPDVGEVLSFGDSEITVVAPNREYDNPNDSSIAVLIRHGDDSFLFTGDAEAPAEADIIANGLDIHATVYKVGHHGSRTATSQEFLDKVAPSVGIVSCAKDNDYGHPHIETLEKLKDRGVKLYRTDLQGSIVAVSEGNGITFDKDPTDNWESGTVLDAQSASTRVKQAVAEATQTAKPESSSEESGFVVFEPSPEVETPDRSLPVTTSEVTYVANTNTRKFHRPTCDSVSDMKAKNRWDTTLSREELIKQGYEPCKRCKP